jgi:hypothetical protein
MRSDARSSARNATGAVDGQPASRAPVGGWERLEAPAGLQLTLFAELGDSE